MVPLHLWRMVSFFVIPTVEMTFPILEMVFPIVGVPNSRERVIPSVFVERAFPSVFMEKAFLSVFVEKAFPSVFVETNCLRGESDSKCFRGEGVPNCGCEDICCSVGDGVTMLRLDLLGSKIFRLGVVKRQRFTLAR